MAAYEFVLRDNLSAAMVENLNLVVDLAVLADTLDNPVVRCPGIDLATLPKILQEILVQRYGGLYAGLYRHIHNTAVDDILLRHLLNV